MIAALAFAAVLSTPRPSCDLNDGDITNRSIGPLTVGEAVRELRLRCPSIRDTVFVNRTFDSADTLSALVARVHGGTVLGFIENGRVHALLATDAGPTTADGLGAGVSIKRFRQMQGVAISASDHSNAIPLTIAGRCGITFFLSGWGPTPVPEDEATLHVRNELDRWPDSVHVTSVSVYGC